MKNKLSAIKTTLLLLVGTICTVQAQWTTTGSNVYTTGKVGIGMNAPLYTLDISGGGVSTAINHLSGSVTSHTQYALGRTAVEGRIGIASSAGDFTTDAAAGDLVLRTEAGGRKILFNTNAGIGASTIAISGNNVGIGTTGPVQQLDVVGNIVTDGLTLSRTGTQRGVIWFNTAGDNNHKLYNNSYNIDGLGAFNGIKWNVYNGLQVNVGNAGATNALSINNAGQVGIGTGTTAPAQQLDVVGNIVTDGLSLCRSSSSPRGVIWFSNVGDTNHKLYNNKYNIDGLGAFNGIKWNVYDGLQINVGNAAVINALSINNLGQIGIGKTPTAYLDIFDNNPAGTALINVGNDAFLTDIDVANIMGIYGQQDNTQGGIKLGSSGPTIFGSAGNVGIGTTAPSALLHVAGGDLRVDGRIAIGGNMNNLPGVMLSVNGSIYSKATYVTVNGWSDNIFDSEYQLKGLEEVEDYIKKNKHLPSIPSEKEIMEKGLDTGEMLKLQMAKIEELTLYLIAQQKVNNDLEKRLKLLEKQDATK